MVAGAGPLVLVIGEERSVVGIHILLVQSSVDRHLSCFYLSIFVTRAALSIPVEVFA